MNDPVSDVVFQRLVVSNPLISLSTSAVNSAWFNLPTTNSGQILNGSYPFTYFVSLDVIANDIVVSQITVTTQTVVLPGNHNYLIAGNTVVFSGSSNTGNNGTKTVVSSTFDSGLNTTSVVFAAGSFTNNENGSSGTQVDISVTRKYEKSYSFTYTGCDDVDLETSVVFDCYSTQFGTIVFSDNTVLPSGVTLDSRVFSVSYPGNLTNPSTPSDVVSALPNITITNLATGTWTHRLTYNMSCVNPSGLTVTFSATTGAIETNVTCDSNICCLTDCIQELYDKYSSCSGEVNLGYQATVIKVAYLLDQYTLLISCGEKEKAAVIVGQIKDLLGADCSCCGSESSGNAWINNAGFESQSLIEQIYNQITLLSTIVQDNADALNAYNLIVAQMNAIFADSVNLVSQLGQALGEIDGLNPEAENFDELVDVIEATVTQIIADNTTLNGDLDNLVDDILAFQTNFPEYATYFNNIVIQYAQVSGLLDQIDTQGNALLAVLATLTPVNYSALISDILDDISDIQNDLNDIISIQTNIINTLVGIQQILDLLVLQVNQNTFDIAQIQAQLNASLDEIFVGQADIGNVQGSAPFGAYQMLPQYFGGFDGLKGYVTFRIDATDANPFTIQIINDTTVQTIFSEAFAAGSVSIQLMLKWIGPNDFRLGGTMTSSTTAPVTVMSMYYDDNIAETRVLFGQENAFRINSTSNTTQFIRAEVIGLKMN
jgi:hypothetical protein